MGNPGNMGGHQMGPQGSMGSGSAGGMRSGPQNMGGGGGRGSPNMFQSPGGMNDRMLMDRRREATREDMSDIKRLRLF